MPTPHKQAQWVRRRLKRGILLGLIAAVAGLSLGSLLAGRRIRAAYLGLNWASLALFGLFGVFVAGQIRQHPLDPLVLSNGSNNVSIEPVPWERIIVCVIAGLRCAGLVFAMMPVLKNEAPHLALARAASIRSTPTRRAHSDHSGRTVVKWASGRALTTTQRTIPPARPPQTWTKLRNHETSCKRRAVG